MATKRMLVDAIHPEETRIVVTSGNRLEEFDFESATRRQLRGNIYLAKVTRVEPSLQAAFIEYGGNRHGFLAFSRNPPRLLPDPGRRPRSAAARRRGTSDEHERRSRSRRRRLRAAPKASPSRGRSRRRSRTDDDERRQPHRAGAGQHRAGRKRSAAPMRSRKCRERRRPSQPPQLQDPGSDQAPAGHAGAGRQGRARQQGRGAHHLPVARRPLLGADAQHRPWRRHLAQDHQRRRPQAPQGHRRRSRSAAGPGHHPAHRRCLAHQGRGQARLRIPAAPVGERPLADPQVDGAVPRLRGRLADQADHPRPLLQGHRRSLGGGRRRLPRGQGLHADDHAEPRQERAALQGRSAALLEVRHRGPARPDVLAARSPCPPAATSSSTRPRRWSRSTSTRAAPPRSTISRTRRSRPTSRPPTKSPASCACAISPA